MKNLLLITLLLLGFHVAGFSQCDTKIILTSSTTEYLDSNNVVERSVPEKTTITIDKLTVSIAPGKEHEMKGTITENICSWKVPYKEGNTMLKAVMNDEHGDVKNATLYLEGKEGKITLIMQVAEMPGKKIRVLIDTFKEAK